MSEKKTYTCVVATKTGDNFTFAYVIESYIDGQFFVIIQLNGWQTHFRAEEILYTQERK